MKHSKQVFVFLLAAIMLFGLFGCGNKNTGEVSDQQQIQPSGDSANKENPTEDTTKPQTQQAGDFITQAPGETGDTTVAPGSNIENISETPSPSNPPAQSSPIQEAKNSADVVYKKYIVSYIEGDVNTLFSLLSAPAVTLFKESYAEQEGKKLSELTDNYLKILLLRDFADNPTPGTLVYSVDCSVQKYYEKDSTEYIENVIDNFDGNDDNIGAFAEVIFKVTSGTNVITNHTATAVLVGDTWQVLTTQLYINF